MTTPPDAPPTTASTGLSQRTWWVVGTVLVLVASAIAVWFAVAATAGRVHWTLTGFDVVSPSQVDVRFDITRDPTREVVCTLEAQDEFHTVNGRTDVRVPAADASPSRHIESVRTASPSVTGYVDSCRYAEPAP